MSPDQPQEQAPASTTPAASNNGRPENPSQIQVTLDLPEGARLRVTVEVLSPPGTTGGEAVPPAVYVSEPARLGGGPVSLSVPLPVESATVLPRPARSPGPLEVVRARLAAWPHSIGMTLFGLALLLYLATRLIGLVDWPIYFFTDEAVQTVLAADLVRDNFKDYEGDFLPTYFKNGSQYNLSASVYLQVLPYLMFGKSAFVTRAISVLVGLLAAISVGLILRNIFHSPYWWSATLLLSITPAWFLHSRTAFETVLFVSLYAAFLYSYLLYRLRAPKYLYLAIGLAALAFYSYSPGQVVISLTALLLLLSDLRYHWTHRQTVLRGLGLAALLALPYLRFRLGHPTAFTDHLKNLASYWIQPLPLGEKLARFTSTYLYGLSPGYWYAPNEADLPRHLMKGYGHLLRWTLPFAAIGVALALRHFRSTAHRVILIALLAAPAGAALVQIGITRALVFVIPAALLTALGLSRLLVWIESFHLPRPLLSYGLFAFLALANLYMLRDALMNGPTWYTDYGLGGMQWGGRQLFGEIRSVMAAAPETELIVSPTWSNGTDVVARFFLADPLPFRMGSVEGHLNQRLPLDEHTLFVLTPDELEKARLSGKFTEIELERSILYPDGRPGFYFARLAYVEDIDRILSDEREARRALLEGQVHWLGQDISLRYPHLDMGEPANAFDGNRDTLLRTLEANPAVFDLTFPQPVNATGLQVKFGATEAEVVVRLYPPGESQPQEFKTLLRGSVEQPEGSIDFGQPVQAGRIQVEIRDTRQMEPGHVHVWEIELK
jgi:hypothetical protein